MKILLIQTAFIGDVVLATALIEKIKANKPNSRIDFLVRKGNESLLFENPKVTRVLIFDKSSKKYTNLIRLIRLIRAEKYDYVVNLQRFFTTGIIAAFSGAKVTIGFKKNPLSFLFTHSVEHHISPNSTGHHEVNRNLALIKEIVGDVEFCKPKLYPSKKDFEVIPQNENYVCIAPTSVWFTKQFPENKWCLLIQKLPPRLKIFLIGGKGDFEICERIKNSTDPGRVVNAAGTYSFLQSAALISKAEMTFANDSAPLHFASAMNAPITALFCSTLPAFGFGPLSDVSFIFETTEKLSCRPCGLHGKRKCPQGHFKCAHIDVDGIISTLQIS